MNRSYALIVAGGVIGLTLLLYSAVGISQQQRPTASEAVQEAQTPRQVPITRPEQQQTQHDQSGVFSATNAPPSSTTLETQPDQGKMLGFEFARDPLNAKQPMQSAEEIMKNDIADKPKVAAAQQQLLQRRYDLTAKLDSSAKMSRGKPLPVGPTASILVLAML